MQLSTSTATATRSLIILIFTIKALIIIPALFCLFSGPGHLQEDEKNPGTRLIFPQPCLPGSVNVPAAQCHATTLGLKLDAPWRATGNLLTRLAGRAERGSARDINKRQRRAFQQAHEGLSEPLQSGSRAPASAGWPRLLLFIPPSQQLPLQTTNTTFKSSSPWLNSKYLVADHTNVLTL